MTVSITKYNEGVAGSGICKNEKVRAAIKMMMQAAGMEKHANNLKEQAKKVLEPYHLATGARQLEDPDLGRVDVYFGSSKRTDPKKMADALIKAKVKAIVVAKAMEEATVERQNKSATVKFTGREKL